MCQSGGDVKKKSDFELIREGKVEIVAVKYIDKETIKALINNESESNNQREDSKMETITTSIGILPKSS